MPTTRTKPHVSKKLAAEIAILGLSLDHDALVSLTMLTGASGEGFSLQMNQEYRCDPATAVRFVRKGIARQGHARP